MWHTAAAGVGTIKLPSIDWLREFQASILGHAASPGLGLQYVLNCVAAAAAANVLIATSELAIGVMTREKVTYCWTVVCPIMAAGRELISLEAL